MELEAAVAGIDGHAGAGLGPPERGGQRGLGVGEEGGADLRLGLGQRERLAARHHDEVPAELGLDRLAQLPGGQPVDRLLEPGHEPSRGLASEVAAVRRAGLILGLGAGGVGEARSRHDLGAQGGGVGLAREQDVAHALLDERLLVGGVVLGHGRRADVDARQPGLQRRHLGRVTDERRLVGRR